jgi:hypothetical protein
MKDFVKTLQASQTFLEIVQPRTTKTRRGRQQDNDDLGARTQAMLLDVDCPESSEQDEFDDAANAGGNGPTGYDPYSSEDEDPSQGSQGEGEDADYAPSSNDEVCNHFLPMLLDSNLDCTGSVSYSVY